MRRWRAKRAAVAALLAVWQTERVNPLAADAAVLTGAGYALPERPSRWPSTCAARTAEWPVLQTLGQTADPAVAEQATIAAKYGPYIEKQEAEVRRLQRVEERRLPTDFDYNVVLGMRNEARQKFGQFRPATIGQAARIGGITPVGHRRAARRARTAEGAQRGLISSANPVRRRAQPCLEEPACKRAGCDGRAAYRTDKEVSSERWILFRKFTRWSAG